MTAPSWARRHSGIESMSGSELMITAQALEGYLFKPLAAIKAGLDQTAVLDEEITRIKFAGTAGLVMHSTIGPISLSVNYYDDSKNQLGVLLHFGFLMFNKTSME